MRNLLTKNWSMMRWVRLGFATFLFAQAYIHQDWMFIVFGSFFFIQAIFNWGCGANGCSFSNK